MGAPVAAVVAALRPEQVRRLVLVSGWAHTDGDEYLRNPFTLWLRLGSLDADAFGRSVTMTGFSRDFLNTIGRDQIEQLIPDMPPTPGTLRHVELDTRVDIRELLPVSPPPLWSSARGRTPPCRSPTARRCTPPLPQATTPNSMPGMSSSSSSRTPSSASSAGSSTPGEVGQVGRAWCFT
ncbi:hypothetical protein ACL02R_09090 [Streptomyces sp. MS19]|uniref:hypothetical protein n=1 Tax=Streptomyces sp. MS19 TaxID=3385972 RepID=UPI0039A25834